MVTESCWRCLGNFPVWKLKITQPAFRLSDENVDIAFQKYVKAKFPFAFQDEGCGGTFRCIARGKTMSHERQAQLAGIVRGYADLR